MARAKHFFRASPVHATRTCTDAIILHINDSGKQQQLGTCGGPSLTARSCATRLRMQTDMHPVQGCVRAHPQLIDSYHRREPKVSIQLQCGEGKIASVEVVEDCS